jgi:hypothetical protein
MLKEPIVLDRSRKVGFFEIARKPAPMLVVGSGNSDQWFPDILTT